MDFQLQQVFANLPLLAQGALVTLEVSFLGSLLGFGLGLVLMLLRQAAWMPVRLFASFYISIFRGTPFLVQIFFIYYALPALLGIDVPAFWAGILALGLNSCAFVCEILRAGFQTIPKQQFEAAKMLALGRFATWYKVIIPQMLIATLPPLTSELTMLIKASPLLAVITVVELTRTAQQLMYVNYRPVEMFIAAAALYFVICFTLSTVVRHLERRAEAFRL